MSIDPSAENGALQQIVFVMDDLPDLQTLLDGLPATSETHLLDARGDALAQMAALLQDRRGIDAIHLLSHGSQGALDLGSTSLTVDNLERHAATLAGIGAALDEHGDILLYGCHLGAGEEGRAFVDAFSAFTGADVAASDDLTGAAAHGGDWQLEGKR